MPNPRHQIQDWLVRHAERRGLRAQVELADTSEHHKAYFVVGGRDVRDEVLLMQRRQCEWWPVSVSVRGGDSVVCEDEDSLGKFLEGVE